MNELKGYSRQSSRQCLFQKVSDNGSMLPWYMGSTLFRYTFHQWLQHKTRQKLHHILKKSFYVAEVSPVHKITFSQEFNSSLTIKSSLRPYRYTGCLKKSKSNGKPFIKRLFNRIFLCRQYQCHAICLFCTHMFLYPSD